MCSYFMGGAALSGDFEKWNDVTSGGHRAGETIGNIAVGIHVFFVVVVTFGGPLQIIPWIRQNAPKFHHWNGRIYILAAYLLGSGGIYM